MKRLLPLILLLFTMPYTAGAQTPSLDSIKRLINGHPKRDTGRVSLLMDYAVKSVNENTTQMLPYVQEVISISKEIKYKRGLQSGYTAAQLYFSDRGDFENAFSYFDSAFAVLQNDTAEKAMTNLGYLHNNVAGDYFKLGDYEMAIRHFTSSARIMEQHKPSFLPAIYSGMAAVYDQLLQPDRSLEYDYKALEAAKKVGDSLSMARRNLNLILRYINRKDFGKAKELLEQVEPFVMKQQDIFSLIMFYYNRAYIYDNKKEYAQAITDYKKAYALAREVDDLFQQINILNPFTETLLAAGNMKEAKIYLDTMLLLSNKHQMAFGVLNSYSTLAKWHEQMGEYRLANDYLNRKMLLSDSISSKDTKEKIAMMEARYKVHGKENEIKVLKADKELQRLSIRQKNIINYILVGSALALFIVLLLSYKNYRHRQKLQQQRITELETEKKLTATEAILKGEEQERSRLAKDLHDGLGGMLSGIKYALGNMKENMILTQDNAKAFEHSINMLDNSITEMRRVAHNMMPESLMKFGLDAALKDFCSQVSVSGVVKVVYQSMGLDARPVEHSLAITIYRVVQELLNNTIRHASAQQVIVQLTQEAGQLTLTVEDDGRGFDVNLLKTAKGIGWKNIASRLDYHNGKLSVVSSPESGTSVFIEFTT